MTRRTIRLEIGQIAFAGVDPGNRRRFERAFLAACEAELRDAQPRGVLRDRARLDVSFEQTASPEALAQELVRSLVVLVDER
jgi:hypothetical protein